ncbi:MAG: DUF853 family protein [Lachnospiraceae bacterium]|nr:DUF853 family protein [Lachnospiraceae bacterium]
MYVNDKNLAWIATANETPIYIVPKMANRHGLVAGATGTGKTVTVKVMAETFSDMGTPVFISDVKGDVSGMINPGDKEGISKFLDKCMVPKDSFDCRPFPSRFFDVFGEKGINVRTTVSAFGPDLLARLLELTDVQAGVLTIVFKVADDNGWLLIDLKDLKAMVKYVADNAKDIRNTYGNVSPQSVGSIQRALLKLEEAGGDIFFGEPELDIFDWIKTNENGKGYINILECAKLVQSPLLYSTFLLWLLSEMYERLPEVGDLDKPKLVFFFDEAHLLFEDAPKALMQKVEQVVRLIRSKGVGVYFISQKPADVPENVLAQLGNRIQHALRAYTPQEQKAVKVAAQSFRVNPKFNTEEVITQLGTGQALVSFLDEDGIPQVVEQARILPPQSSMTIADEMLIKNNIALCPLNAKYAVSIDRQSAYEELNGINIGTRQGDVPNPNNVIKQGTWTCSCGKNDNTGKFCMECGAKKPDLVTSETVPSTETASVAKKTSEVKPEAGVKVLTEAQLEAEKQKAINAALKEKEREDREKEKLEKEAAKKEAQLRKEIEAEIKRQVKAETAGRKTTTRSTRGRSSSSVLTKTVNSATGTIGREIGKQISRGILGGIKNLF